MTKNLFYIFAIAVLFVSCGKTPEQYKCTFTAPTTVAPTAEVTALQNYINSKGLAGVVTSNAAGFYYKIDAEGTGGRPDVCSNVTITYSGKLTDDTEFDSGSTTFLLGQLIKGWQLGLPLIKKGGKITLYLPPSLGYGSSGSGPIPPNAILIFTIELLDVTTN
ncbi:MAG: FKBP-type peptidyl-prolyl cis-trans isomerase [Ferruginibacter sp.]